MEATTRIRITPKYGKPHTYKSIWTWHNAHKRTSYAYQLEMLKKFASHLTWKPSELNFIRERINNITTNHSDCLCAI